MTITNEAATPDEQGVTDAVTEGAQTQALTEAKFTQQDIDRIVTQRLAEQSRTAKTKFDKELETKLSETKEAALRDLDKLVEERTAARIAETALINARAEIAADFGLTATQAERLVGDSVEALNKDAEALYGQLKKPAVPIIKTGTGSDVQGLDISRMSPSEIRANASKLWPK